MRVRGDLLILIGALMLTALLALSAPQQQPSTFSSYDTGRNGYRALYETLRRESVRTGRFEGELGALHDLHGAMVLSVNALGRIVMPATDVARLAALVRGGARLVMAGPMLDSSNVLQLPDSVSIPNASQARSLRGRFTHDVGRVAGSFSTAYKMRRGVRVLLVAGRRAVAIEYAFGRGTVIAIGAADVFSNIMLARDSNAWFAWNLLGGVGTVLFDERLHGYETGNSMWSVMPAGARGAVWICIAILVLAVTGNAFRSAPPVMLEPRRARDSSSYITAMASLLRRAHAGSSVVLRFARDAARLARSRASLSARPEIREHLERLERIAETSRPSDAALIGAAQEYVNLRRELAR